MTQEELNIMEEKLKKQVDSICTSFRHDYGLMPPSVQTVVRRDCKFWIEAIIKEIPYLK